MENTTNHRLTPQRQAVLSAVRDSHGHLSASEVWIRARKIQPRISFATVYNSLHYLCDAGMLIEIPFGNDASIFDGRIDPHDHAVCRECGRIADYECKGSQELARCASEQTGYVNTEARITVVGTCPACSDGEQPRQ